MYGWVGGAMTAIDALHASHQSVSGSVVSVSIASSARPLLWGLLLLLRPWVGSLVC